MAPFRRRWWADLPPELICHIGEHLDVKGYTGARGACTAWRRALVPLSPTLLVFGADKCRCRPYATSLTTRRSLELTAIVSSGTRCVGSSSGSSNGGWLALSVHHSSDRNNRRTDVFVLLNPVAGMEILLPPLVYDSLWVVSKVVFTSFPGKDDFAAAAICDAGKIAYVAAGASRWAVVKPGRLIRSDHLVDVVVYTDDDNGKAAAAAAAFYCVTMLGDVHVLRLPDRRRLWKSAADAASNVDEAAQPEVRVRPSVPREFSVLPHRRPRLLNNFPMMNNNGRQAPASELQLADLNFSPAATVEPLLSDANPATDFASPYHTMSSFFSAKNLVFCKGTLYQVWRNDSCTVTLNLRAGTGGQRRRRVPEHEILVLRYYPERRPCWDVVKDLEGHSFFVGRNNAVSMYAEGVPGLRGNCVYWIGGHIKDQGMVFDMESGRSTPCRVPPPVGFLPGQSHRTICWYFL